MWKNGKQHGKGTYTASNGHEKEGEWEEGKRVKWISVGNEKTDKP